MWSTASSTSHVINEDGIATRPPAAVIEADAKKSLVINEKQLDMMIPSHVEEVSPIDPMFPAPTTEELSTLRKVPGSIPWVTWFLCLVEFAERASYYGAKQVFANFLANDLPKGNTKPIFGWPEVN
jgi:hypothetical protein